MENTSRNVLEHIFFVLACGVILFFIIGSMILPDERQEKLMEYGELQTDWYAVNDDGSSTMLELPVNLDVPRGEPLCVRAKIPEDISLDSTKWLCITAVQQDVSVYIDGQLRKSYSTENTRLWGDVSVSAYLFVPLRQGDAGRELTMVLKSNSSYSGVVHRVYIGNSSGIWRYFIKDNLFAVLIALFIFILSVVSIIIDIVLSVSIGRRFYLGFLSWGVLLLSIWVLAQSPIRQLYFDNVSLAGYMTHIIMYIFVVPIVVYLDYVQKKRYTKLYRVFYIVSLIFFVTAIVLEITGAVKYSVIQMINSVIQISAVVDVVITLILDTRSGEIKKYKLIAYGFLGLGVSGILQLLMYFRRTVVFTGSILCIGAVFLLVMAVISTVNDYITMDAEIKESRRKNEQLTYQIMETLVHTIEAKDEYTKGHSTRVAEYSRMLAAKMGMSEEEQMSIYFMGTLHDIGKIGINDDIINKPGRLTDEEYAVVKSHPIMGYNILKNMSEIKDIEFGARWHHERYDGKGYPDGLSGEEIPVFARIIAVADAYDAMTSNRSYREIMPQEAVRAEIIRVSGTQLDPVIASYMVELIDADKDYKMSQSKV